MTPAEFSEEMRKIYPTRETGDREVSHINADDLLVKVLRGLGYGEGCDIYEAAHKWHA